MGLFKSSVVLSNCGSPSHHTLLVSLSAQCTAVPAALRGNAILSRARPVVCPVESGMLSTPIAGNNKLQASSSILTAQALAATILDFPQRSVPCSTGWPFAGNTKDFSISHALEID